MPLVTYDEMLGRMLVRSMLIVSILAGAPLAAPAQHAVELDPNRTYPIYAYGEVRRNGGPWEPAGTFSPSRRASVFNRQELLVRLALRGDPRIAWVVRAQPQIDVFELIDPKNGAVLRAGMRVPFDRRPIENAHPTLPIPPGLLDGTPFLIRIETSTEVREPIVATQAAVTREDEGTRSVVFLLIGFYGAVGLIFGLLYISLRDKQLLYYAVVLLSLVLFEGINKAYAWQYLWPGASLEWHVPNALAFVAYYAALVLFCSRFLDSSGNLAVFRRTAVVLLALNVPAAMAGALLHDLPGVLAVEETINTAMLATLLFWALFAWRGGQRSARFYAIAFAGLCAGVVINRLALDQVIPHTFLTEWILEYGVAWEVVWLSLAVAGYLNQAARENAVLHAVEVQLQRLANVDGLTGIANRRAFDERLSAEWRRCGRIGRHVALLLIDVDLFKQYNDAYGHLAGDDCLRRIAQCLAQLAGRASDLCARYGGEEFAVVVGDADPSQIVGLGEQMRRAVLELAVAHPAGEGVVTISIGVAACVPTASATAEDLVAAADRALYAAKRGGRNAVVEGAT